MEIAVISDLHLGTGDAADGFGHEDGEFLKFLTQVAKAYPRRKLHLVCDNYATHVCPESEVMEM